MRNQLFHGQSPAKDQVRGLLLEIYRRAIRPENRAFPYTYVRTGHFDAFLVRSLGKQKNSGARARASHGLLDDPGSRSSYDHQIGAAAASHALDAHIQVFVAWVKGLLDAETQR